MRARAANLSTSAFPFAIFTAASIAYGTGVRVRYEHVVFDLDGTLVNSAADLAAAVNHALRVLDLPLLPLEAIAGYVGEGARRLVERALGPAGHCRLDEGLGLFLGHYREHLLDHTRLYPGIAETLSRLAQCGVALSVLSNKPVAMCRAILEGLGVLARFVAVVGGDSLPVRKPDPAGIFWLAALTGTARARMLFVGDSAIDGQTARAAGVAFCGVTWGFVPNGLEGVTGDWLIESPQELLAIVAG